MIISKEQTARILDHPGIPKALWGVNPRTVLHILEWEELRQSALNRAQGHCEACGWRRRLECHEAYVFDYAEGIAHFDMVWAICANCHMFIHLGRLFALELQGKVSAAKVERVIKRGVRVLGRLPLDYPRAANMLGRFSPEELGLDAEKSDLLVDRLQGWETTTQPWKMEYKGKLYTQEEVTRLARYRADAEDAGFLALTKLFDKET